MMNAIEPRHVRDHVDRIASSTLFAESERLRRFLRFTVESKLSGSSERIKEYVLGREVFDRDGDYDPRLDPIVRVEARRLRSKLAEYYGGPGRNEPIRLEYPKGTYTPEIRSARAAAAPRNRIAGIAVVAALLIAIAAVFIYRTVVFSSRGFVAVVPAAWAYADRSGADSAAEADLAEALSSQLANRRLARVVAWPLVLQHQSAGKPRETLASDLHASQFIVTIVRPLDGGKHVTVFAIDPASGQKLLAQQYDAPAWSLASVNMLAAHIAGDLSRSKVLR